MGLTYPCECEGLEVCILALPPRARSQQQSMRRWSALERRGAPFQVGPGMQLLKGGEMQGESPCPSESTHGLGCMRNGVWWRLRRNS